MSMCLNGALTNVLGDTRSTHVAIVNHQKYSVPPRWCND